MATVVDNNKPSQSVNAPLRPSEFPQPQEPPIGSAADWKRQGAAMSEGWQSPALGEKPAAESKPQQMLARQKALQQSRPDTTQGGRGIARWINRTFRDPVSEERRRANIQAISAVGDVLRHAANLWGTSRGANNQNIASGTLQNQARWQQQDALEAQRQALAEKAASDREKAALARSKAEADAAYKEGMLGQGAERNRLAWANYDLASQRNDRDNAAFPYEMAGKAANAEYKRQQARKAGVDADWAPRLNQAQLANRNASTAAHNAAAANSRAKTRKTLSEMSGGGGTNDGTLSFYSGNYGHLLSPQKKNLTPDQVSTTYTYMVRHGLANPAAGNSGGEPTTQQQIDAISAAVYGNDERSRRASHFLASRGFLPVDSGKRREYERWREYYESESRGKGRKPTMADDKIER